MGLGCKGLGLNRRDSFYDLRVVPETSAGTLRNRPDHMVEGWTRRTGSQVDGRCLGGLSNPQDQGNTVLIYLTWDERKEGIVGYV